MEATNDKAADAAYHAELKGELVRDAESDIVDIDAIVKELMQEAKTEAHSVPATPELERIETMPRRTAYADDAHILLTKLFAKNPEAATRTLFPAQAQPLLDLYDYGGAVGALKVGEGKTDAAFLAAAVASSRCAVMLIPGGHRQKTQEHFAMLQTHYDVDLSNLYVVSYQELSRERNATLLFEIKNRFGEGVDLIIADECTALKNPQNAATRRCARYMQKRDEAGESIRILLLSGTLFEQKGIKDYYHLLKWALGAKNMPLPATKAEALLWSRALDKDTTEPIALGALRKFIEPKALDGRESVRKWLGQRIRETPGITVTESPDSPAALTVEKWRPKLDAKIRQLLHGIEMNKTPEDDDIDSDEEQVRMLSQAALGFYLRPKVKPPEPWRIARRNWNRFVRVIKESGKYDTEFEIRMRTAEGKFGLVPEWEEWKKIKPSFNLETEVVWISPTVIDQIVAQYAEGFIIWVENRAVGFALEARGHMFFHEKCKTNSGIFIEHAKRGKSIVASIHSCFQGLNLQHEWANNLIAAAMPANKITEQMIGRTHRKGQKEDLVRVVAMVPTDYFKASLEIAKQEAKEASHLSGVQKLLLADWL